MNLNKLNSLEIISKSFNISLEFLQAITVNEKNNKYIELFNIPKKNPKYPKRYREVIKINTPYNTFYKELLHIIEQKIEQNKTFYISDIAHGFIKNRGVLTNAKQHLNKKYLFKIDIKDYFKSIPKEGIKNIFFKLDFSENGADIFANLCSFNDILYEGFNTSPILANLFCYDLDLDLIELAKKYDLTATRYSDDIAFSSNYNNFPSILEIEVIFKKYNFKINNKKTIKLKYGQPLYVTGLSISNDKYPRVPKRMKKKIRQNLYYMKKYPENYFHVEDGYPRLREIYGKIVYILGIEKNLGKKYQSEFINILEKNSLCLENIYMDSPAKENGINIYHYIDESEFQDPIINKHYLILALISISGDFLKNTISDKLTSLKTDLVSDLRNRLSDNQKSKLFHYCEDNIMIKEKYISILRELHIEAFIMFKYENNSMNKKHYQNNYYALFNNLIKNILRRNKSGINHIVVEENSKISLSELKKNILIRGNFFPNTIIEKSSKDDILLSIPDYILGIIRDCVKKDFSKRLSKLKEGQSLVEDTKFYEISDKIRLIADLTNNKFFSRQNKNKMDCLKLNEYMHNKNLVPIDK